MPTCKCLICKRTFDDPLAPQPPPGCREEDRVSTCLDCINALFPDDPPLIQLIKMGALMMRFMERVEEYHENYSRKVGENN